MPPVQGIDAMMAPRVRRRRSETPPLRTDRLIGSRIRSTASSVYARVQPLHRSSRERCAIVEVGGEHFDGEVAAVTANTEQLLRAYELFTRKYWVMWALDWVLALTGQNPRTSKKVDAGRGGYFRVRLTQSA